MYVWAIEIIGAVLMSLAFGGLIIGGILFFLTKRSCQSTLILIGLIVAESGRLFRVYGPSYTLESDEIWYKISEGSSQIAFVLLNLLFPFGLFLTMIGFLSLSWKIYKNRGSL
ncbi:hypothetical protein [Microbulbifer sp. VAAF005]|uniref:hypothetical protein n=1 Tax=Microbulbifer sp. VAAF005 TaxID=3034230 RepID=UPI0024ADCC98|nr:hypothetical protein [Microbulbifer sp. VAAF005]WHI47263.1 hypothetical protein P0078_02480 [Microbulbifer sp. VAAF005]